MTTSTVPRAATVASTLSAEWLKLRSVRSTWWFVAGCALLMVLVSALESDNGDPATVQSIVVARRTLSYFVQYALGALGLLAITSEFATRNITVTLACTPSRARVMTAKALAVGGMVLLTGSAVMGLGVVAAAIRLGELGSLGAAHAVDVLTMGAYLAMLAVISLGIGSIIRRTAGGLTLLLVLLLVLPEVLRMLSERFDMQFISTIGSYTPAPAGWRFMAGEEAYGLVLVCWAVTAVAAGAWALRARDL